MFRVHFLDVGYGDAIILQFENRRTYLIDSNEIAGKVTPYEYLTQTLKVTELETVVATHPHRDHVLGLQKIVENIPTRQVWLSEIHYRGRAYSDFEATVRRNPSIRVQFPHSGMMVAEGKDRIRVLAPPPNLLRGTHSDVNNASLVLKITIVNPQHNTSTNVLLGADAQFAGWAHILTEHASEMRADVLKLSHHGSGFGTYKDVLAAIRPRYTVIPVGPNNYGHPEDWAIALVGEATSERVFRTDTDGTCVFESDGIEWQYRAE